MIFFFNFLTFALQILQKKLFREKFPFYKQSEIAKTVNIRDFTGNEKKSIILKRVWPHCEMLHTALLTRSYCCRGEASQMRGLLQGVQPKLQPYHTHEET